MNLIIGNNPELISKSQSIRHEVFVVEQCIPQELDLDGIDDISFHALVLDNNALVATARLSKRKNKHAVLARVAVVKKYRGMGIAAKVINGLISYARHVGVCSIEIHAHKYLQNYYEKFGFKFIRDVEIVGEHQLIEMQCKISSD